MQTAQRGHMIARYRPRNRLLRPIDVVVEPDDGPLTTSRSDYVCSATRIVDSWIGRRVPTIAPSRPASDTTNRRSVRAAPIDRSIAFGECASSAIDLHPRITRPVVRRSLARTSHRSLGMFRRIRTSRTATRAHRSSPSAAMIRRLTACRNETTPTASAPHRAADEVNPISTDAAVA